MAILERIFDKNEEKIYINKFLPYEINKYNENGELIEEDYITIKKIPYDIKTKIKFLSMKSFDGETTKELLKKYKQSGKTLEELQNIDTKDEQQVMDFMLDVDFSKMETDKMAKSTLEIERLIIEYGVDPKKHTLYDGDGNLIYLDYETLNLFGNDEMMIYIIKKIKDISKGFVLGE